MIRKKNHRLPISCYVGYVRCAFTLCIVDRKKLFIAAEIINPFILILKEVLESYQIRNWIYTFMPDHVHLILEGLSEESNLWQGVKMFKQKTGFMMAKRLPEYRWQKGFYDHLLRTNDDLKKQICYITDNPFRKGLSDANSYPYTGSVHFRKEDIFAMMI